MQGDASAREEALDPQSSFIVQAPAGSGKTGLLTQRLLRLLGTVSSCPEECLALTFTRKAAKEMRDRLLNALQRAKNPSPPENLYERKTWELAKALLIRDQTLGWDILQNPSRLKIQTIDAFCAGLTHEMPILSKIGVLPKMVADPFSLYETAAVNLLNALETKDSWSKSVWVLLSHLDNNWDLAKRLLAEMLAHRDQWLPYLGTSFKISKAKSQLETGLQRVVLQALEELQCLIPPGFHEFLNCVAFAARELAKLKADSKISLCQSLEEKWPGKELEFLPIWLGLAEILLTEENHLRKTVTVKQGFRSQSEKREEDTFDKAYYQAMKSKMISNLERLREFPQFIEALCRLRECPPIVYQPDQWEVVVALAELLPILNAELTVIFQQNGEIDFTEVTLAALRALGENEVPTDLALKLDYKIQHILVDEFQDTSLTQYRLLEKLTLGWEANDGRTLFLVGDPMQSIYRFRQAEVGLFIKAKQQGLGDIPLKFLQLDANFRSDPVIVSWITEYFQRKFPTKEDIATGAVAFHASQAVLPKVANTQAMIEEVSLETEANRVVELIKEHYAWDLKASIALLVRSRTHLIEILPKLRQANIAFQAIELERLENRRTIQDLFVLTRALCHLGDRIAWLALLRIPEIALSLSDLWLIANFDLDMPLWHAVLSYENIEGLSVSGARILQKLVPILNAALAKQGRLPLRDWVLETGSALKLSALQTEDGLAFLALLEKAQYSTTAFLETLEIELHKLFEKPKVVMENTCLQVMTIHKAKGLEFDTVIVPGVGRKMHSDPQKLILWEEGINTKGRYFLLGPIKPVGSKSDPIYGYLKKQETQRADYEATRLAYVAATRARKRLHWLVHQPAAINKSNDLLE